MQEIPLQNRTDYLLQFILQKLNLTDCSLQAQQDLMHSIRVFICIVSKMKAKIRKDSDTFMIKSKSWLDKEFKIPDSVLRLCRNSNSNRSSFSVGCPTVSFDNANNRTKRRKVAKLLSSNSLTEVVSATCTGIRRGGKKIAKHIAEVVASGHTLKLLSPIIRAYTNDEALSFFIEGKFSKYQYKIMRMNNAK